MRQVTFRLDDNRYEVLEAVAFLNEHRRPNAIARLMVEGLLEIKAKDPNVERIIQLRHRRRAGLKVVE